jgi:recombinational DNA repair protein (RecF pathway)
MDMRIFLGCAELKEALGLSPDFPCCISCHEDADEWGFPLMEVAHQGKDYEVCCEVARAWIKRAK